MIYLPLIPARGGSKGIPGKNIIKVAGDPLIAWSIRVALANFHAAYVSTDDAEIAAVAKRFHAEVIDRPAELAGDLTSTEDVVLHALEQYPAEAVVLLQPTSPTRTAEDLKRAIQIFEDGGYDSLLSVHALRGHCLWACFEDVWTPLYLTNNRPMRQNAPEYFAENGAIYISRAECYTKHGNRLAGKLGIYEMDWCPDIDHMDDIKEAEGIIKGREIE